MLVLEGMQALIDRDRPYIVAEVTGRFLESLGSSKWELTRFMATQGYTAYRVGRAVIPYEHIENINVDSDLASIPSVRTRPALLFLDRRAEILPAEHRAI